MNLSDYILLPRQQRIAHINLIAPCNCWAGNQSWAKEKMRKNLLTYLTLHADVKGYKTPCCHLCEHNSKSGAVCINPLHMYIGTPTENILDLPNQLYPTRTLEEVMSERGTYERTQEHTAQMTKARNARTSEQMQRAAYKAWETKRAKQ
jgi:hypothetical protein